MNRAFWILIGAVITIALISTIGLVSAHYSANSNVNPTANAVANDNSELKNLSELDGMQCGMHSGNEMHSMMSGMECMGMSVEEMDADGDGFCDYCGMKIEDCQEMQDMHGSGMMEMMHNSMHSESGSDEDSMPCGMENNDNGMHSNGGMMGNSGMHSMMEN